MDGLIVIISICALAVYIYTAIEFANVAVEKGYKDKKNVVIALCILFPLGGYLLVCAYPDKKGRNKEKNSFIDYNELPDL